MLIAAFFAALFTALGIACYRGWNKSLVVTSPSPTLMFGTAWLGGAALAAIVLSQPLERIESRAIRLLIGAPVVASFFISALSIVWLPPFLTPRWYRGWVDRGKHFNEFSGWEHMPRWERTLRQFAIRNEERTWVRRARRRAARQARRDARTRPRDAAGD